MKPLSQIDYDIVRQRSKNIYIKIELLNMNFTVADNITGVLTNCSINIDSTSAIRRTASLELLVKDSSLLISSDTRIWLDKYIKIYYGIEYLRTGEIIYYSQGIYLIDSSKYTYNTNTKMMSLSLSDLMSKYTGDNGGAVMPSETVSQIIIESPDRMSGEYINIKDAVKYIMKDIAGLQTQYMLLIADTTDKTIPYDLEYDKESTIYDMIKTILELYKVYEIYFDESGMFVFDKIPMSNNDTIFLDSSFFYDLVIEESIDVDFSNIKNKIVVWSKDDEYCGTWEDIQPDSPYNINRIGIRGLVLSNENYVYSGDTDEDINTFINSLNDLAKYEGYIRTRIEDSITISMVDVPWLSVNKKVKYKSIMTHQENKYIIKSISHSPIEGTMNVTLMRYYEEASINNIQEV